MKAEAFSDPAGNIAVDPQSPVYPEKDVMQYDEPDGLSAKAGTEGGVRGAKWEESLHRAWVLE